MAAPTDNVMLQFLPMSYTTEIARNGAASNGSRPKEPNWSDRPDDGDEGLKYEPGRRLLAELRAASVRVEPWPGSKLYLAPRSTLTHDLIERILRNKAALIEPLGGVTASAASSCDAR